MQLEMFHFYTEMVKKKIYTSAKIKDIEDITCLRVDMNFIFEWSTRYDRVEHEKIKFISINEYIIFCLVYKHQ